MFTNTRALRPTGEYSGDGFQRFAQAQKRPRDSVEAGVQRTYMADYTPETGLDGGGQRHRVDTGFIPQSVPNAVVPPFAIPQSLIDKINQLRHAGRTPDEIANIANSDKNQIFEIKSVDVQACIAYLQKLDGLTDACRKVVPTTDNNTIWATALRIINKLDQKIDRFHSESKSVIDITRNIDAILQHSKLGTFPYEDLYSYVLHRINQKPGSTSLGQSPRMYQDLNEKPQLSESESE